MTPASRWDAIGFPVAMIAAVARNGVIGSDNRLPWSLPSDLRHFRALTMGQPVVMGRRTYQSIGRPLPGRFVVVISADPSFAPEGATLARTPAEGLSAAAAIGREKAAREIVVAGGGTLYGALMKEAQRLYITEIDLAPPGDVAFPAIDGALWRLTSRIAGERAEKDAADFAFLTYDRVDDRAAAVAS